MRRPRSFQLIAALLGLALLGAACGDDDDASETATDGVTTTSPPDAPATSSSVPARTTADELPELAPVEISPDGQCGSPAGTLESAADAPAAAGSGLDDMARSGDPDAFGGFGEVTIAIESGDGTSTGWCVLLADSGPQLQRGLMQVTDLKGYAGMLFVHPSEADRSFWMKNTVMPLSIAWFDNEGSFVSATDMEPCVTEDCPSYYSEGPARFSLEVPQGDLELLGIDEDTTLRVGGT